MEVSGKVQISLEPLTKLVYPQSQEQAKLWELSSQGTKSSPEKYKTAKVQRPRYCSGNCRQCCTSKHYYTFISEVCMWEFFIKVLLLIEI